MMRGSEAVQEQDVVIAAGEGTRRRKRGAKAILYRAVSFLLILVGVLLMLYPWISPHYYAWVQASYIEAYQDYVAGLDAGQKQWHLDRRDHFARQLAGEDLPDPYVPESGIAIPQNYDEILDFDGMIGWIDIPSIQTTQAIFHGIEQSTIDRAVGHSHESAFPGSGASPGSNCVLMGHNDTVAKRLFTNLEQLVPGDLVYAYVLDERYTYRVFDTVVVEVERAHHYFHPQPGKELLTLLCCESSRVKTHRFLAIAERVEQ